MRHRDETSLVGWFFHSFAHTQLGVRSVELQGRVVGRPEPGWYLVQFSQPETIQLVKFERMSHWQFYPDSDSMMMTAAYEKLKAEEKESQQSLIRACPRCKEPGGIPSTGPCTDCANGE
jgi:hypothetical protein